MMKLHPKHTRYDISTYVKAHAHEGATLAVSLLLLLIITLLGISAMQVGQMEEKMSANLQDKLLSFSSAESALRAGEKWVLSQTSEPTIYNSCPSHPCVVQQIRDKDLTLQTDSWWGTNGALYGHALADIKTPARYIIEYIQFVPDTPVIGVSSSKSPGVHYYQVTSRATGGTDDSISILQTTVARRY